MGAVGLEVLVANQAIHAAVKVGRWVAALDLFERFLRKRLAPTLVTFNTAISACAQGGAAALAAGLLGRLLEHRLRPDVISFNSAISACARAGRPRAAAVMLRQARSHGVCPDVVSYNAAISACERGGRPDVALILLRELKETWMQLDIISFSAAISSCEKAQWWQSALDLLSELCAARLQLDAACAASAAAACAAGGAWAEAAALLVAMERQYVRTNICVYNAVLDAHGRCHLWHKALHLLEHMYHISLWPDATSLGSALSAAACAGAWRVALGLLAPGPAGEKVNVASVTALLDVRRAFEAVHRADAAVVQGLGSSTLAAAFGCADPGRASQDAVAGAAALRASAGDGSLRSLQRLAALSGRRGARDVASAAGAGAAPRRRQADDRRASDVSFFGTLLARDVAEEVELHPRGTEPPASRRAARSLRAAGGSSDGGQTRCMR